MKFRKILLVLSFVIVLLPSATLAFYKPSRVLFPQLLGLECPTEYICVDRLEKLHDAELLRAEALTFVNEKVGRISHVPRFIFCSTKVCADKFGQYHAAAFNVGTIGIVIRTKGWEKHYVRHELIHHLQNERLGSINAYLFKPQWFLEGMAYSLSEDPRRPIPADGLEGYRRDFEAWDDGSDIWARAIDL